MRLILYLQKKKQKPKKPECKLFCFSAECFKIKWHYIVKREPVKTGLYQVLKLNISAKQNKTKRTIYF